MRMVQNSFYERMESFPREPKMENVTLYEVSQLLEKPECPYHRCGITLLLNNIHFVSEIQLLLSEEHVKRCSTVEL